MVRAQARRQDKDVGGAVAGGATERGIGNATATGVAAVSRGAAAPTLEKRFSSMANLAEARDGGVDGLNGAARSAGGVRKVASEPALRSPAESCKGAGNDMGSVPSAKVPTDDALSGDSETTRGEGEQQRPLSGTGGGAVTAVAQDRVDRQEGVDIMAVRTADEERETRPGEDPSGDLVAAAAEDVAATRIQASCRRRAARNAVNNRRKRHRSSGEEKTRPPVGVADGDYAAANNQQLKPGSLEERERDVEKERAVSPTQNTHRQAAEIRRARSERERCLQDQQFLFGPGFQQPAGRSTRDTSRGGESSRDSDGQQSRQRDTSSLASSEEGERQSRSSRAAIKIQTQARRKAASRRAAAARQRRAGAAKTIAERTAAGHAAASVPRLPIASSVPRPTPAVPRAAPKVQREPLAILRQLRNDPEAQPKPRTDQFRLRMTIRSAVEAHIKKTGAARRKPRPLPTVPSSRQNIAKAKMKLSLQQQQQQHAAMVRAPLSKARAVSPLHRTVRQVNAFFAATHKHERGGRSLDKRRVQSAPLSKATDRLRCAIFAAETMVEREYARAERRQSFGGNSALPMDDLSRDQLSSPLLVPYQPPALMEQPVGGSEAT